MDCFAFKGFWLDSTDPVNCTAARKGVEITADFLDPASEDGFFDRANADLYATQWWIIGFGCGVAMFLGFAYLFVLRIPGVLSTMVWGLITLIFLCIAGLGGFMYNTSSSWADDESRSDTEVQGMLYLSYFVLGCAALWAFFICCIRTRIKLAVGCVKEAAKAVQAMPVITIYPVFQVTGVLIFLIPWIIYMTYLASGGTVVVDCICPSAR